MANVQHSALTGAELHEPKGAAAATAGQVYVADGAASGAWAAVLPVGMISPYGGASAPTDWQLCYGQAISRTTYSALFTAISTTYGVGDGSTTFNLPDLRGRVVAGQDDMGGAAASRLVNAESHANGCDGSALGNTGGDEGHVLTEGEMPSHYHTVGDSAGSTGAPGGGGQRYGSTTNQDSDSKGSDEEHNNVQPTIILNYIIYAAA